MGMFDTIYVHKTLLHEILKDNDILLEPSEDGYCDFQSKDLDNTLTSFYLKENGSFCYKHQEYVWKDTDPKDEKNSWRSGYMEPVGDPIMIGDNRNAYLEFYDFYYTEEDRVYVTFVAHVTGGRLAEPIKLKSVEKTNLEKEAIETKKYRDEWDKIKLTWQWKLATFIFDFRNKVRRLFYPIFRKIDDLDSYLRKQAKKGTLLDENLRDR